MNRNVNLSLDSLIQQASELTPGEVRLWAIRALKEMRIGQADAHDLCQFLSREQHPAVRTMAAQVLGYHDAAGRYAEVKAEVMRRAAGERDPLALKAMVFALRHTEGTLGYLTHDRADVALEAALGLVRDERGLQALLKALFGAVMPETSGAMCRLLSDWEGATGNVVAFLMTSEKTPVADRVSGVFAALPRVALLGALTDVSGEIERTYKTIWPGIWRRERQRILLDMFVQVVRENGAGEDLIGALVGRIGDAEVFYDRYIRFIRALLHALNEPDARAFVAGCEALGKKARREALGRLSEVLIELLRAVPSLAGEIQRVLGQWEAQLPGIRAKAFHAGR